MKSASLNVKAVLFDFDGTLTRPGALDFPRMKRAMGCPAKAPILEFIASLPGRGQRDRAFRILDAFEAEAAARAVPNEGSQAVIQWLKEKGLKTGIISRNSRQSILRSLENFKALDPSDFHVILSREASAAPKPSPEAVLLAARKLDVKPEEVLVVGDYVFDIQAGNGAGAWTVLLKQKEVPDVEDPSSDFVISRLGELVDIVRLGLPLGPGKLPNDMLQAFLKTLPRDDPSVVLFPGVGEDVAAVEVAGTELIILKSDPITFVSESLGRYAVAVNANDIATSGATPRWLLTTLLFPCGTVPWEIQKVMAELAQVAKAFGITLVGGHTEITDAVTRPVITASVAGTVSQKRFVDKKSMRSGDTLLLTKSVAVEGTAIIAREFTERLAASGMTREEIQHCRNLLSHISVLKEAGIASDFDEVHAMHDVTEGGLATAVAELGVAGHRRLRVDVDRIPVYPETQKICSLLGLDPLGLIGSGSLLIACSAGVSKRLMAALKRARVPVACIGEVLEAGSGIEAFSGGNPVPWPHFERDELARLFG